MFPFYDINKCVKIQKNNYPTLLPKLLYDLVLELIQESDKCQQTPRQISEIFSCHPRKRDILIMVKS